MSHSSLIRTSVQMFLYKIILNCKNLKIHSSVICIYLKLEHVHLLLLGDCFRATLRLNMFPDVWSVDPKRLDPLPFCLHLAAVHYFVKLDFYINEGLHVSLLALDQLRPCFWLYLVPDFLANLERRAELIFVLENVLLKLN